MRRNATIGSKIGGLALIGNVALIAGIFYRRNEFLAEEAAAREKWEAVRERNFRCYFASKRYFDQCRFVLDDSADDDCKVLASETSECKKELAAEIPLTAPAMQALPRAFRT